VRRFILADVDAAGDGLPDAPAQIDPVPTPSRDARRLARRR
jgi:hypothetical protein